MMHVAGVDGCRGGWLCVEENDGALRAFVAKSVNELLADLRGVSIIAIDVPIGLPDSGERPCDPIARRLLRPPRASSVFPVPVRDILGERDYKTACSRHRQIDGRGMSRQAFAILHKIHEVDLLLAHEPGLQQRVREIHPEVCFAVWNGGLAMKHKKSIPQGLAERQLLIDKEWPSQRQKVARHLRVREYQPDDLNDAFAALWTARRIVAGTATVLSPLRATDRNGLRMEIWA